MSAPTLSDLGNPIFAFLPLASNVNGGGASDGAGITSATAQSGDALVAVDGARPPIFHTSGFGSNSVPFWYPSSGSSPSSPVVKDGALFEAFPAAFSTWASNAAATGSTWVHALNFQSQSGGLTLTSFTSPDANSGRGYGGDIEINGQGGAFNVDLWPYESDTAPAVRGNGILTIVQNPASGGNCIRDFYWNGSLIVSYSAPYAAPDAQVLMLGGAWYDSGSVSKLGSSAFYPIAGSQAQLASWEIPVVNYIGISGYTPRNVALVGNNTFTVPVGTQARQTTYSILATASTGGTGTLVYQWSETTNLSLSAAQIVATGTPVGTGALQLDRTGATAGTTYKLALKTTDSASTPTTVISPAYQVTTGGSKLLKFAYIGDSTEALNGGYGNDAQNFERLLFGLVPSIAFGSDPYTPNPYGSDNSNPRPKPFSNYASSGITWHDFVTGGNLANAISNEASKGAGGATVFHCSVGFNDATGFSPSPGRTAAQFIADWHTAVQMFQAAGVNVYYQLPWEWSQDVSLNSPPLIPQYRAAVLADTYNASTNPYGMIGHPNVKIGDQANVNANQWSGALHPANLPSDIAIAIGNWAVAGNRDINGDPVFFGLPPNIFRVRSSSRSRLANTAN